MNIINETTYDLVKLKYILFNKFDQRVFYKIFNVKKSQLVIEKNIIGGGFIHSDGNVTKLFDNLSDIDFLNSSTHFKINDNENYRLLFDLKIDTKYDECKVNSCLEFEETSNLENKQVTTKTEISHKDAIIPFDKDELYIVIIYPNNQIPALVRFYDNIEFDLFNIDDKNALYNSYLENVNISKSTKTEIISQEEYQNVSILKMEEDEYIQRCLKVLSKESFDPETGIYHNDVLNLTVDEHDDLIIDGVNLTEDARYFNFNLLDEKDEPCTEFEFYDQLKEIISEIIDNEVELDCGSWIKINDTFIFKVDYFGNVIFVITKSKYAIFVSQLIETNQRIARNKIVLIDLEKEQEMLLTDEYGGHLRQINCLSNFNQNGYTFKFNYILSPNEPLYKIENPIYEINRINKTISGLTADVIECYFQFANEIYSFNQKSQKVQINKLPITDLLTGEDDEGKYILVRGVFGNLTKYYYEK